MTGIENITGRIQADAQAEIDRIQADARREAERISAGYADRADRECADLLARGEKSAQERGSRLVSAAEMESRKMTLAAKQEVLDQAFELALQKLLSLPQADYVALLAKLAASAARTGRSPNSLSRSRPGPSRAACCSATAPWRSTAPWRRWCVSPAPKRPAR